MWIVNPLFLQWWTVIFFTKKVAMLVNLSENYDAPSLMREELDEDPIEQFNKWFEDVLEIKIRMPNAMTLATCTQDGTPSARVVLLKECTQKGFTFYTNYQSQKGQELVVNPKAALVFYWVELHRQVCIRGKVVKENAAVSTQYFQSRPRESQIGAWASPQSSVIANREVLDKQVLEVQEKFAEAEKLPRPEHWGGFLLKPEVIEFWQGRPNRLHDRFRYSRRKEGGWEINRLAP